MKELEGGDPAITPAETPLTEGGALTRMSILQLSSFMRSISIALLRVSLTRRHREQMKLLLAILPLIK